MRAPLFFFGCYMDRVTATLKHILESDEYVRIPNVPVFDEHDEWDEKGNLVRRFDRKRLQAIVDTCNAKTDTGDLTCIGPGHTIPHAPETQQPPIWGYAANWKLDKYGPGNKLAACCDYYIRKTVLEDGKEVDGKTAAYSYPRRSIELWSSRNDIDWIALLRKAPERPMGLVTYARTQFDATAASTLYYRDPQRTKPTAAVVSGGKLRYSMEAHAMPFDPDPDAATSAEDPTQMPNAQDDPDEKDRFLRYLRECYPHLDEMHNEAKARYEAGPGALGPTNASIPTDQLKPEDEEPMQQYSREAQEAIAKLKADNERLAKEKDEASLRYARAESERLLDGLRNKGLQFDRSAELADMEKLDAEGRKKKAGHIERYYRSTGPATAPSGGLVDLGQPESKLQFSREDADNVKRIMTAKGISFEAAKVEYQATK
jgi:hypothetical protein